jgi:Na+/phosphate symporter
MLTRTGTHLCTTSICGGNATLVFIFLLCGLCVFFFKKKKKKREDLGTSIQVIGFGSMLFFLTMCRNGVSAIETRVVASL